MERVGAAGPYRASFGGGLVVGNYCSYELAARAVDLLVLKSALDAAAPVSATQLHCSAQVCAR